MTREDAKDYIREWCPYDRQEEIIKALEQEPCEDCIRREDLLKAFKDECRGECDNCPNFRKVDREYKCMLIVDFPSVTPREKTGKWIENAPEYQNIDPPYICSECGNMHLRKTNYCDQCGAKMVEPQKSEEV